MSVTPSQIYWISTFDSIIHAGCILGILSLVGAIIGMVMLVYAISDNDDYTGKAGLFAVCVAAPIAIVSISLAVFLPTSRTAAAMYIVPAIANNEKVQDVGNKLYDLAVEWMHELKPGKKGGAE